MIFPGKAAIYLLADMTGIAAEIADRPTVFDGMPDLQG